MLTLLAPIKRVTGYDTIVPYRQARAATTYRKPIASSARLAKCWKQHESLQAARPRRRSPGSGDLRLARRDDDDVKLDQPLLAVETAKAIVEIPSPRAGKIKQAASVSRATSSTSAHRSSSSSDGSDAKADAGTVVGRVETGNEITPRDATAALKPTTARVKATPAVRALARQLDVDLAIVTPTGPNDTITTKDVERVARILKEVGPLRAAARRAPRDGPEHGASPRRGRARDGQRRRGPRMQWWPHDHDLMLRLIRAIVAGCKVEPALNAWFDSQALGRRVIEHIISAIAVDTADGLFVRVLRDVGGRTPQDLREGLERLRRDVQGTHDSARGDARIHLHVVELRNLRRTLCEPDRAAADRRDLGRRPDPRRGRRRATAHPPSIRSCRCR